MNTWRTGKETQWPGWPAWIVHFTDYSPDRKTPLERTFRAALTEDDALAVAAEMVTENIKKGWKPAAGSHSPQRPRLEQTGDTVRIDEPSGEPKSAAPQKAKKAMAKKAVKKASSKKVATKSKKAP